MPQDPVEIHIDYGVLPNCVNPDSYGEICVRCGQCGRKFGKAGLSEQAVIEKHGGDEGGNES